LPTEDDYRTTCLYTDDEANIAGGGILEFLKVELHNTYPYGHPQVRTCVTPPYRSTSVHRTKSARLSDHAFFDNRAIVLGHGRFRERRLSERGHGNHERFAENRGHVQ